MIFPPQSATSVPSLRSRRLDLAAERVVDSIFVGGIIQFTGGLLWGQTDIRAFSGLSLDIESEAETLMLPPLSSKGGQEDWQMRDHSIGLRFINTYVGFYATWYKLGKDGQIGKECEDAFSSVDVLYTSPGALDTINFSVLVRKHTTSAIVAGGCGLDGVVAASGVFIRSEMKYGEAGLGQILGEVCCCGIVIVNPLTRQNVKLGQDVKGKTLLDADSNVNDENLSLLSSYP
nr:hypothetical protein Iba_chr15aCG12630 [Ipomoea batatas]